jgi:hypothetical protein
MSQYNKEHRIHNTENSPIQSSKQSNKQSNTVQ